MRSAEAEIESGFHLENSNSKTKAKYLLAASGMTVCCPGQDKYRIRLRRKNVSCSDTVTVHAKREMELIQH